MPATLPIVSVTGPLCCAPIGSPGFSKDEDIDQLAVRLRALADGNRLRLIQELSCCDGHAVTTSDASALLGVTEATASHHLKQLQRAGLVTSTREGARVLHRLDLTAVRAVGGALAASCGASCAC
jgi:DNA-binding transcriptional ArsR family regulator